MASRIARFIKALTLSPLVDAKSEILILSPFGTTIVMRSYALELYLFLTADDVLPIFDTSSHFCIRCNGILCKVCQWKILYKVCYTMRAAKGEYSQRQRLQENSQKSTTVIARTERAVGVGIVIHNIIVPCGGRSCQRRYEGDSL